MNNDVKAFSLCSEEVLRFARPRKYTKFHYHFGYFTLDSRYVNVPSFGVQSTGIVLFLLRSELLHLFVGTGRNDPLLRADVNWDCLAEVCSLYFLWQTLAFRMGHPS